LFIVSAIHPPKKISETRKQFLWKVPSPAGGVPACLCAWVCVCPPAILLLYCCYTAAILPTTAIPLLYYSPTHIIHLALALACLPFLVWPLAPLAPGLGGRPATTMAVGGHGLSSGHAGSPMSQVRILLESYAYGWTRVTGMWPWQLGPLGLPMPRIEWFGVFMAPRFILPSLVWPSLQYGHPPWSI
jgi:hypothetical protein